MMKRHLYLVIIFALVLLTLVQTVGTLVESIYILELLNTSLDFKAAAVVFLLAPALLFAFRDRFPDWLIRGLWVVLVLGRAYMTFTITEWRLVGSGMAAAAALMLLPMLLRRYLRRDDPNTWLALAQGLALAILVSILLRTLNHSVDISLSRLAVWPLAAVFLAAAALIYKAGEFPVDDSSTGQEVERWTPPSGVKPAGSPWLVISSAVGMMLVLTLAYFAFFSPAVIARWTESDYSIVVGLAGISVLVWLIGGNLIPGWFIRPPRWVVLVLNLLLVAALVGAIVSSSVRFPASLDVPAAVVGKSGVGLPALTALLLVLAPVLLIDFSVFSAAMARSRPTPRRLAAGFLLGSFLLLVLIFMLIFTNVWGYVPPVSNIFRNKFWLPFGLAGGLITWLAWASSPRENHTGAVVGLPRWWLPAKIGALLVVGIAASLIYERAAFPSPDPRQVEADGKLTLMTYNIQQANDAKGRRAYRQQAEVIRAVDPDILALQESDTARISIGNNDYVRYFAQELGYYVYYGPRTVTGTYGTAILSRLPIEDAYTFFSYSDLDEVGTAVVRVRFAGQVLWIINVHPDGSDAVMDNFVEDVLQQAGDKQPVILLGDFNLRPEEPAYQRIAAEYQNVWQAAHPDETLTNRIDHILVSPSLAGSVEAAEYIEPPQSQTDHPTLWAIISFP